MSNVTILWSLAAASALLLAIVHLTVWIIDRQGRSNLAFVTFTLAMKHVVHVLARSSSHSSAAALRQRSEATAVKVQKVAGSILAGIPLLASGQTPKADVQAMQRQQQALEVQVREQNARIQELERLVRDLASAQAAQAAQADHQ